MVMLLSGRNGNEFELGLTRERLTDVQDGFGDSGWATVTWRAATDDDSWEESSPCVNRYELVNLVEWLESVAGEEGDSSSVDLLCAELRFSVVNRTAKGLTLRIDFHLPDRPEEYNVDSETDASAIDILLDRKGIAAAAASLRATLDAAASEPPKDDLLGERDLGIVSEPDPMLSIVDSIEPEPPGAGVGEDNAGNR